MRRSWVLADGERKRLTALKSANKFMTSLDVGQECPSMDMSSDSRLMMDKEESEQIQDLLDKMTMIRNQTEDMNPEVWILVVWSDENVVIWRVAHKGLGPSTRTRAPKLFEIKNFMLQGTLKKCSNCVFFISIFTRSLVSVIHYVNVKRMYMKIWDNWIWKWDICSGCIDRVWFKSDKISSKLTPLSTVNCQQSTYLG